MPRANERSAPGTRPQQDVTAVQGLDTEGGGTGRQERTGRSLRGAQTPGNVPAGRRTVHPATPSLRRDGK